MLRPSSWLDVRNSIWQDPALDIHSSPAREASHKVIDIGSPGQWGGRVMKKELESVRDSPGCLAAMRMLPRSMLVVDMAIEAN